MRPELIGCFDLGHSLGLGDTVFDPTSLAPELDISLVGWTNPLGRGVVVDLIADRSDLVQLWRGAAAAQLRRPEFETSWSEQWDVTEAGFDRELEESIAQHGIALCQLTIYALGTVLTRLQLAPGLPDRQVQGVLRCFEYAAYTAEVSMALFRLARERAAAVVRERATGLKRLSERKPPEIVRDAQGYEESRLFSGFTHILLCVDEGDSDRIAFLREAWGLSEGDIVEFEYHGRMHYSWAACLLEPRYLESASSARQTHRDTPDQQILRMLACIQLAHVFLGSCEAMTRLFIGEMHDQAGGYVARTASGRSARELNRLRTLALAINSLTTFNLVTPTSEDQNYFTKFESDAQISRHHRLIADACDVLYNVQMAEQQALEGRRQFVLNTVLLLLTSLTFISVLIVAYDFIRANQEMITPRLERAELLALAVILLTIPVALIVLWSRPSEKSR